MWEASDGCAWTLHAGTSSDRMAGGAAVGSAFLVGGGGVKWGGPAHSSDSMAAGIGQGCPRGGEGGGGEHSFTLALAKRALLLCVLQI